MLRSLLVCSALAFTSAFVLPSAVPLARAQPLQQQAVTMIALTKPQRTNNRRREYNKMYKSEMKTAIKRVFEAVAGGDYKDAQTRLNKAQSMIDKNVKRHIMHKNTAARRKSLLTLKVKALEGPAPAAAAPVPESA